MTDMLKYLNTLIEKGIKYELNADYYHQKYMWVETKYCDSIYSRVDGHFVARFVYEKKGLFGKKLIDEQLTDEYLKEWKII